MKRDYDNLEFSEEEEFVPNLNEEVDELPDDYTIPLLEYKTMFNLPETYDIEEDGHISDKIVKILNSTFEELGEEVIDFDYTYDDNNIYIENILWGN